MPIIRSEPKPSQVQIIKAQGCIAFHTGEEEYLVWNPETDSKHTVLNGRCDCQGFLRFSYCYHLTAVSLHKENLAKLSAKQATSELYDL